MWRNNIYIFFSMFWCFYHFWENKKSTRKSQPILADYEMIAVVIFWIWYMRSFTTKSRLCCVPTYFCQKFPIFLKQYFTTTYVISVYHCCEFEFCSWRDASDTTLCDKVLQLLAAGRYFSPVFPTNKTDHHDITEILLKVPLDAIILNNINWICSVKLFRKTDSDILTLIALLGTKLIKRAYKFPTKYLWLIKWNVI